MITNKHRFHGLGSVQSMYKNTQQIRGEGCSLRFRDNHRRRSYRLAVIVSKKVNKSAVARNRIRRRIYEAVRHLEPTIKTPKDMVITVYDQNFETEEHQKLQSTIEKLLKKAEVI